MSFVSPSRDSNSPPTFKSTFVVTIFIICTLALIIGDTVLIVRNSTLSSHIKTEEELVKNYTARAENSRATLREAQENETVVHSNINKGMMCPHGTVIKLKFYENLPLLHAAVAYDGGYLFDYYNMSMTHAIKSDNNGNEVWRQSFSTLSGFDIFNEAANHDLVLSFRTYALSTYFVARISPEGKKLWVHSSPYYISHTFDSSDGTVIITYGKGSLNVTKVNTATGAILYNKNVSRWCTDSPYEVKAIKRQQGGYVISGNAACDFDGYHVIVLDENAAVVSSQIFDTDSFIALNTSPTGNPLLVVVHRVDLNDSTDIIEYNEGKKVFETRTSVIRDLDGCAYARGELERLNDGRYAYIRLCKYTVNFVTYDYQENKLNADKEIHVHYLANRIVKLADNNLALYGQEYASMISSQGNLLWSKDFKQEARPLTCESYGECLVAWREYLFTVYQWADTNFMQSC